MVLAVQVLLPVSLQQVSPVLAVEAELLPTPIPILEQVVLVVVEQVVLVPTLLPQDLQEQ
tara:strand:- start:177 stop:356 length:180 start_codon:yes stop_codon:yes gene_type:complete